MNERLKPGSEKGGLHVHNRIVPSSLGSAFYNRTLGRLERQDGEAQRQVEGPASR
jgi:hypothetical protein